MRRQTTSSVRKTPFFVISAALLLALIGIIAGEPRQVLSLAIRICLSCIGIG